ncbi:succinyl-diaminopimelate desuccinylase [Enemella evansiae]|uniref:Succinyl-diaminopimelate desuccinylase n=1 Tax=Enemella evansiae TaxID=2016499 RepID=A0A255G9M8_9ACTN|nr:succinyl-diaminopimelate desuccinylase [Enemella evansiae]OYO12630.1 succinyl-diaminopimelate desuccinylase [Enemella evansiae]
MSDLDLSGDVVDLFQTLVDIESVSGNEGPITDAIEAALQNQPHLKTDRIGNTLIARTELGRDNRVLVAGHTDTVPLTTPEPNLPSRFEGSGADRILIGRGTCDMKGGVAVALSLAAELTEPVHDVTWVCYDNEEVEAAKNGLNKVAAERPELLAADFAVLGEPTGARVEGGCQGTMRAVVTFTGTAAHSARAWMGHNAIHDAAELLNRLTAHEPEKPMVDGLEYHEGLNAVRITGGIAGNVIPDRCEIELNYRFAPDKDLAAAEAYLTDFLQGLDFRITDKAAGARPGLDLPVAQGFLAAVGGEPRAKYGWTDVSRFAALGVPAVNFGPADPIKAHTDDEYCPIDQLHRCREVLGGWLSGGAR